MPILIKKLLFLTGVAILCVLVFIAVVFIVKKARPDPYRLDWSDAVAKVCSRQYTIKGHYFALKKIKDKEELRQIVSILTSPTTTDDEYIIGNACAELSRIDPDYVDFIIPILKDYIEEERPGGDIYHTFFSALAKRKNEEDKKFIIEVLGNKDLDHFLHKKRKGVAICEWIIGGLESATGQKIGHDHQKWIAWFEHH
jgi:hypothetical protein